MKSTNTRQIILQNLSKNREYYILLVVALTLTGAMWLVAISNQRNSKTRESSASPDSAVVTEENVPSPPLIATSPPSSMYNPPVVTVASNTPPPSPQPTFAPILPVSGSISQQFAADTLYYSRTMEDWRTHDGMDIAADLGTQVRACEAGRVESIDDDEMLGKVITISHGDGLVTRYANLQEIALVRAGQNVTRGMPIGGVGVSAILEGADPPHLHFEMILNGRQIDPMSKIR